MISRRRWQNPLLSPRYILCFFIRIIPTFGTICKCNVHDIEKVYKTYPTLVRAIRTNHIPPKELIGVVQITTWHSCKTQKVLREKCKIDSLEEKKEMPLSMMFRILTSSQFANPKIKSSENSKHSSHTL